MVKPKGLAGAFVAGLVAAAVLVGGGAYAAGEFRDVPPGHPFEAEITALAESGITTGYDDATFRPGDPITRQAMAAFLTRGLGQVWFNVGSGFIASAAGGSRDDVAPVTVTSPTTEGSGYVLVHADVEGQTDGADCPCRVGVLLEDGTTDSQERFFDIPAEVDQDGFAMGNLSLSQLFVLPGGATRTYAAEAAIYEQLSSGIDIRATVTATYVPFGHIVPTPS